MKRLNGIKPSGATAMRAMGGIRKAKREPLAFVPEEPDPLAGVKPAKNMEVKFKRELSAFGQAFRDSMKNEAAATYAEKVGYGAEYFVVVFQDADQATAFLRNAGYPEPKDVFIDGPMLAEAMGVEIPASLVPPPRKLKKVQDKKLAALVTRR